MYSKYINEIATELLHPDNTDCRSSLQFVVDSSTFAVINCSHYLQPSIAADIYSHQCLLTIWSRYPRSQYIFAVERLLQNFNYKLRHQ